MKTLLPLLLLLAACSDTGPDAPTVKSSGNLQHTPEPTETPATTEVEAETAAPPEMVMVTVYYRHPLIQAMLPRAKQIFHHDNPAVRIKQVIDQLSLAPKDGYGFPIWPANTHVREIYLLSDGGVVVDIASTFLEAVACGAAREELMVYSLVNSILDNFNTYEHVYLLIDGEIQETFLGHIDIERPLRRNKVNSVIPDEPEEDTLIEEDLLQQDAKVPPNLQEG